MFFFSPACLYPNLFALQQEYRTNSEKSRPCFSCVLGIGYCYHPVLRAPKPTWSKSVEDLSQAVALYCIVTPPLCFPDLKMRKVESQEDLWLTV